MKAVIIQKFGDLEGSSLKTGIDIPTPGEHEVCLLYTSDAADD